MAGDQKFQTEEECPSQIANEGRSKAIYTTNAIQKKKRQATALAPCYENVRFEEGVIQGDDMSETDKKEESEESDEEGLNDLQSEMSAAEEIKSILSRKSQNTFRKSMS